MKTKTIELDGQSYVIAPLNMEQVEAIMDAPPTSDPPALRAQVWSTISHSLANAGTLMELGQLKAMLSLPSFNALHSAILELSGLKTLPAGEEEPGETPAASILRNSAAASLQ